MRGNPEVSSDSSLNRMGEQAASLCDLVTHKGAYARIKCKHDLAGNFYTYQGLANLPSKCSNRVGINSGNHPCSTSRLSR